MSEAKAGAWSNEAPVTLEVLKICLQVKETIQAKIPVNCDDFIPHTFRSQLVAGTNYLVKVFIAGDECAHVWIFQDLPCNGGKLTVPDVQFPKKFDDPLNLPKK
ncbi:cystatin-like [Danio rerio]|uniref:Cystatin 14b, tandem duplicate 2 n=1 Tax=Danio rerio TaxID=7955 RepID=A0A2R8RU89_DANRE|nr:cystatin-like [Danio rerio]|eukprot:XP_005168662.1 cystatin-B-like [Danio rerio]